MAISFSWFCLLLDSESSYKSLFSIPLFDLQVQHFKRSQLSFIDYPEEKFFSDIDIVMSADYLAFFDSHSSIEQRLSCEELVSV